MNGTNHTLEPVLDASNVDNTWQWSLVEVAPGILDELLEQLKPADSTSNIAGVPTDLPSCYLKPAPPIEFTHESHSFFNGIEFVALREVPLPALCTNNHVLGLKQRRLEHLSHLILRPSNYSTIHLDQNSNQKENIMANAPLFLPLRPVLTSNNLPERENSPFYIVSNVRYTLLGAIIPADYNLLYQFMCDETERRFRNYALNSKENVSNDDFDGFRIKEFLTTNLRIPQKVAENEMFRQYSLICLPRKSRDSDFVVLPLDEEQDLATLALKFFPLLEAHIKKVFEDSGRETVSEFSFFTALYILGCAVDELEFAFSALLPNRGIHKGDASASASTGSGSDSDRIADCTVIRDKAVNKTSEWVRDPFIACQILRYLVTSVRNGFDCIIPTSGSTPTSGDPEYISALCKLESTCQEMSITQRTGYRMGINELKIYYVLSSIKFGCKEISPQTLMKLSYGGVGKEMISPSSLFPFQSHVDLRIAPISTVLKECKDVFASMFNHYRPPDIAGAMANARSKITGGNPPDKWFYWNWNIGMFGEVTKSIITGQLGFKQVPETLGVMDREIAMFLALLGGKAFTIELPESVFASLPPDNHISNATKQASYLVFCDARSLSWNWETRLKDLYRMKRLWPLVELREYIGPLLKHDTSLSLERVVATYLEPHPTIPGYYQNSSLHLERP